MLTISPCAPLAIYGRAIQDVPLEPARDTIEVCLDGRRREYGRSDGKRGFRSTREYIIRRPAPYESSASSSVFSIRDVVIPSCRLGHQKLSYLHTYFVQFIFHRKSLTIGKKNDTSLLILLC